MRPTMSRASSVARSRSSIAPDDTLPRITSSAARPYVRSIIERFRRETAVLSQGEIHPRVRLKTVGSV